MTDQVLQDVLVAHTHQLCNVLQLLLDMFLATCKLHVVSIQEHLSSTNIILVCIWDALFALTGESATYWLLRFFCVNNTIFAVAMLYVFGQSVSIWHGALLAFNSHTDVHECLG